ncbi:MAG: glycosyltransferase family 2 protein [Rhizonema sp. NSF051]|nr:glycosyltransferase family 2 protein [Rhizonema sp. NSF051]
MNQLLQIQLPELNNYKQEFAQQGITTPLATVPFSQTGLLAELPPPPSGKTGWPWTVETQSPTKIMLNDLPWPRISIVTPSYNQGRFIEETIRSVLLQNYPNLEFIICDGGSNDETQQILEKYSPWLSFWQSKKDRGQGHAINLGFSLASGRYFGWINSDDFYLPNCFQLVATHFSKYSPDLIYGDSITIYDNDSPAVYCYANLVLDRYLRFGNIIASHAAFWKSAIHVTICENITCAIDYELWLRLVPKKVKSHLKAPLGVFRVQNQSKSSHKNYKNFWQEDHEKIVISYGLPPRPRSFIYYEFRLVQGVYKKLRKQIFFDKVRFPLQ